MVAGLLQAVQAAPDQKKPAAQRQVARPASGRGST